MRSCAKTAVAIAGAAAVGLAVAPARAQQPKPKTPIELDVGDAQESWRQILMAPRITGNLRAVAVDPTNPKSIYVGTEEGTLVHTSDGGVTWDEIELSPFQLKSATIQPTLSGDDYKIDVFAGFKVSIGQYVEDSNRLNRPSAAKGPARVAPPITVGSIPLFYVDAFRFSPYQEPLLGTVSRDPRPYEEIQRVRVCPGGTNSVLVLTRSARLWGSPDGVTFVPLYQGRESAPIVDMICSPTASDEVIMTTGDGTFISQDGGGSFDAILGPVGAIGGAALAYGPAATAGGQAQLFVAAGRDVWIGDPAKGEMHAVTLNSEGAILHLAATDKSVWVSTETGVRGSTDGGNTWVAVDELEGFGWTEVAVAAALPGGQEHVAVLRGEIAFESDDAGKSFHPFFRAESRRRLRQLVATSEVPRRFLLVTSGELWASGSPDENKNVLDEEVRRWARERLRRMRSASDVIQSALAKTHLTDTQIDGLYGSLKARGWLPGLDITVSILDRATTQRREATVSNPTATETRSGDLLWGVFANAVWELPDVGVPSYNFAPARKDLYEVRKRLEYVIVDAYDERKQVLTQLATSALDAEQILTLQSRVEALDTVIDEFTR